MYDCHRWVSGWMLIGGWNRNILEIPNIALFELDHLSALSLL
jgi:hypothetical protein